MAIMSLLVTLYNATVTAVAATLILAALVWLRHRFVDIRIRQVGGSRAPVLAGNLFTGIHLYYRIGTAQLANSLPKWCNTILDAARDPDPAAATPHFVEFSLTGAKRVLITRDPEQIKTILTTKFTHFGHGPQWHRLWQPFLGDGIFATDGQHWRTSRALIRPMFMRDRLRNLAIFDSCTERLLSKLPVDGVAVDVKDLFFRWALDTTTEFILGEGVNSLDFPDHNVANAISVAQKAQMLIFVLNPIAPLLPKRAYLDAIRQIEAFIEPVIARAIALPDAELDALSRSDDDDDCRVGPSSFTFLHSIARVSRDPKIIRDQVMSVLLAARDTTAATLSWAMYELAGRPETWATLRAEVLDVIGDVRPRGNYKSDISNDLDSIDSENDLHQLTYETLKNMPYLKKILNETLRLHPPVPLNMRQALRDTTVPGRPGEPDIVLLKGDTITINTLGLHTRSDLYSNASPSQDSSSDVKLADPNVFSPERWNHWTPKPWTYTPFHGGPRTCVGQNFALTEMAYCLARLAQRYERIEYRGDWAAQSLRADIIGTPALDVPIAFFEGPSTTTATEA